MTKQIVTEEIRYTIHYDMGKNLCMSIELLRGSNNQKEVYTVRDTARQGILLVAFAHREDECTYIDQLYCEQESLIKLFMRYVLEYNMYVASLVAIREEVLDAQTRAFYEFVESYYVKDEGYLFLDVFRCYDYASDFEGTEEKIY